MDLNEAGRAEALRLRPLLSVRTYRAVLSSPRRRALQTCELAGLGDRVAMSEDLVEWDYGDAEGLTTAEIRATCPGWSLFGNGPPGGELLSNVAVRADRVIESLRHDPPGVSILFSHGHFLRVLAARWVGLQPEAGAHLALDAASVSILGDERETPVIRHWNGIDHLGG